jgi:shikimate 5-dehydrogenase
MISGTQVIHLKFTRSTKVRSAEKISVKTAAIALCATVKTIALSLASLTTVNSKGADHEGTNCDFAGIRSNLTLCAIGLR